MARQQPTRDEITAYHEAGHAVVALAVGMTVQKVTITAKHGRLGAVMTTNKGKQKKKRFRDRAEDDLLVLLGGMVAEARLTGRYCTQGASQDLLYVSQIAMARGGSRDGGAKVIKRMLAKVEYILSEPAHWQAVRYIVEDLLEKRDLSGRAAKHHFERALAEADE